MGFGEIERARSAWRAPWVLYLLAFLALFPGCAPAMYTFNILPASSAVHSAEAAGAAEWAPYEYWTAQSYLDKAAEEANEGNYQDAIRFAERASEYGRQAQDLTAERRRRAGREAALAGGEGSSSP
jgi:hypothetical protein